MNTLEFLRYLVPLSAYLTVSLLVAFFRRPIEEFLAEELLKSPLACRSRIESLSLRRRAVRWSLRYGFPRTFKALFLFHAAAAFILWPLSILVSVRFYLGEASKQSTLLEIFNDV
jgi:hypothetical protein